MFTREGLVTVLGQATATHGDDVLVAAESHPPDPAVLRLDGETGAVLKGFVEPATPPPYGRRFGEAVASVAGNVPVGAPGPWESYSLADGVLVSKSD